MATQSSKTHKENEFFLDRSPWGHVIAIAVLTIFVLIYVWPLVTQDKLIFLSPDVFVAGAYDDFATQYLAWQEFTRERLKEGDLPLWSPMTAGGMPFFGNAQAMAVSPITLLFLWQDSTMLALIHGVVLMALLSPLLFYVLLRNWRLSFLPSLLGALFFSWESLQHEILTQITNRQPQALGLLNLTLLIYLFKRPTPLRVALLGLSLGANMYTGDIQVTFNVLVVSSVLIFVEMVRKFVVEGPRSAIWVAVAASSAILIGLCLGAPQILTMMDTLQSSVRNFTFEQILETRHFGKRESWSHILLCMESDYCLWPPLFVLGVFGALQKKVLPIMLAVLGVLAFEFSQGGPLYYFLYNTLPFFKYFKIDQNWFFMPMGVCYPALIALGLQRLQRLLGSSIGLVVIAFTLTLLPHWPMRSYKAENEVNVMGELSCFDKLPKREPLERVVRFGTAALPPSMATLIGRHDAQGYDSLMVKTYVDLYDTIEPGTFKRSISDLRLMEFQEERTMALPVVDFLGIRTAFTGRPLEAPGWNFVYEELRGCYSRKERTLFYENSEAGPRAFFVAGDRRFESAGALREHMASSDFRPYECALFEADTPGLPDPAPCPPGLRSRGEVEIVRYEPDLVEMDVTSEEPGWVVLVDTYMNGWEARLDGEECPILRAYSSFRAVRVSAGTHRLTMEYRPVSFLLGVWLALLGLLAFAGLVGWSVYDRRKRRTEGGVPVAA